MTLRVVSVSGVALVQDGGRPGHLHEGIPVGGALVPELLARANRAVGNPWEAAAIELFMGGLRLEGDELFTASLDGEEPLAASTLDVPAPGRRVRYVAIAGGLDVPVALGGRGTLPVAKLGGLHGRMLRKGDVLPLGPVTGIPVVTPPLEEGAPVRVVRGPDSARFPPEALAQLTTRSFRISPRSDRVGTRLEGAPLPRLDDDRSVSGPMVCGAIQVPGGGEAIVLGPDGPTLGGYPVLATVITADRGRFGALKVGTEVRFEEVTLEAARAAWREQRRRYFE